MRGRVQPQQSYVDVNDGRVGLMVVNAGLYEYEFMDNEERAVALTLLRCTDRIDARGEFDRIPMGQCPGEYRFGYSLIPHAGGEDTARRAAAAYCSPMRAVLPREMEEEALPFIVRPAPSLSWFPEGKFLEIEPAELEISAMKQHEERDSAIVRVFNPLSGPVQGRLRLCLPGRRVAQAHETRLDEMRVRALPVDARGWMSFSVSGRGLFTVELEIATDTE